AFSSAVRRPDLTSPLFPYTTLFRSLIEQKEAGLLQEQFGQGYPHLPSPTELLAGPVPVASRKTQAVKHCPHSRIDCVASLQPERSEEHTSELQSLRHLVCRLLLEKK